jgi:hypothetical protein
MVEHITLLEISNRYVVEKARKILKEVKSERGKRKYKLVRIDSRTTIEVEIKP